MPYRRKAEEAGIVQPEALALLGRVFDRSAVPDESGNEREARASRILAYYQAGVTDEDELVTLARQPLRR